MPLYDYRCRDCGKIEERFYGMHNYPHTIRCQCGGDMGKVCNAGGFVDSRGKAAGIIDSNPAWLNSSVYALQDPEMVKNKQEAPIESRSDLRRYLDKKGLAFGDECELSKPKETRIDPSVRERAIRRIGEAGMKDRAITVGKLKGTPA